jgi:hypothetical protein
VNKRNRTKQASKNPKALPIFPSGTAYDAMPAGARDKRALLKRRAGAMRQPDGSIIPYPEDTVEVDLEFAITHEANMRIRDILASGKWPSAQDLERCATKPPMSGPRLSDLLMRLNELTAQQWRRAALEREQAKRKHMSDLASRKRKPRGSRWDGPVKSEAVSCYEKWRKHAGDNKKNPDSVWGTTWKLFAPACIESIKNKTGKVVTEDQLRRSILPVENYPRPPQ